MEEEPALGRGLLLLDRDPVRLGEGILADAGHLPRDLSRGDLGLDHEAVALDAAHDPDARPGAVADHGELVAEVAVERLEPVRQLDRGVARSRRW